MENDELRTDLLGWFKENSLTVQWAVDSETRHTAVGPEHYAVRPHVIVKGLLNGRKFTKSYDVLQGEVDVDVYQRVIKELS